VVTGPAVGYVKADLVRLFACLLAIAFTGQRFFHAPFFARLQIKGMTFNFLDNVFGLHLALKAAQCIFKGFAFLNSNLCQRKYTSTSTLLGNL